ncbi:pentapeptide repeat-containing protein [Actinomadura harenae]|nr:pentapeptide repeat-containing protein [Actinomadura harenae]
MLLAAGAAATAIWLTTAWLLEVADGAQAGTERARIRVDAVRTGLAAGAGAGAAVGLMLAFRRQRHAELATALNELDAAERRQDAIERRVTELYNAAAEQLGSDKAPVRLTALYTLERLANGNPGHRQTIVNIICAYLRMPFPVERPEPEVSEEELASLTAPDRVTLTSAGHARATDWEQERHVRLTAQRILGARLRPATDQFWADIELDLTGATLIDFSLFDCRVSRGFFHYATFTGDTLFSGEFSGDAEFHGAGFTGGLVGFVDLTFGGGAFFGRTTFTGHAVFGETRFTGRALFSDATFAGDTTFRGVTFEADIHFPGADFQGRANALEGIITVSDTALVHQLPPHWRIEPAEGTTGTIVQDPAPGSGG